jgi:hypothetical protein
MHRFKNASLMALTICAIIQNGAQLFAVTIVARIVSKAPPRSFAILTGEYAYDSGPFWDTIPMITQVLFLTALVANWKSARRKFLLAAFTLYIVGAVIAMAYLEPTFDGMFARGYADYVDPVMQKEAGTWWLLDFASWVVGFASCVLLLFALVCPATPDNPAISE